MDRNPRVVDGDRNGSVQIDLGAFGFPDGQPPPPPSATFSELYPDLEPSADSNANGRNNFFDYASGFDRTVSTPGAFAINAGMSAGSPTITFSTRPGLADAGRLLEHSAAMQEGSWTFLAEGVHYRITGTRDVSPERREVAVEILADLDPSRGHFFRQRVFPK